MQPSFFLLQLPNTNYQIDLPQLCLQPDPKRLFFLGLSTKTKEPLEIFTALCCLVSLTAEGLNMLALVPGV